MARLFTVRPRDSIPDVPNTELKLCIEFATIILCLCATTTIYLSARAYLQLLYRIEGCIFI